MKPPIKPNVPAPDSSSGTLQPASTGDLMLGGPEELLVELTPDGRLRAPRERTRQILRERMGRAEVLQTGLGWAILRSLGSYGRASTREEAEQRREVAMAGVLGESGVALIDVIGFLASGLQTGVLTVSQDEVHRSVYLSQGDVVWATSNAPGDQIGEFLHRRGKISAEQLKTVSMGPKNRIGRSCVEHGFISAHGLWSMVQAQLTEIFDRMLETERGIWSFSRISQEALSDSQVHLPTQGLLMDSLQKLDEMRLYRDVIRSSQVAVRRAGVSGGPAPAPDPNDPRLASISADLREAAKALYVNMPLAASVQDLMRQTGKSEWDVTRLLYHLVKAGLLEVAQAETTTSIAPRPLIGVSKTRARDIITVYSMAIREVFNELNLSGQAGSLHDSANAFLRSAPAELYHVLAATQILPDGGIDEAPLLAVVQTTTVTAEQLNKALSELLFFLLFEASEHMPPRRRDDLARRVKMIHAMLPASEEGSGAPHR